MMIIYQFFFLSLFLVIVNLQILMNVPSFNQVYSSSNWLWGYWFTSPVEFKIVSLRIKSDQPNMGFPGDFQVVFLDEAPPRYPPDSTDKFTTVFSKVGHSGGLELSVDIDVPALTKVGIIGSSINGVTLYNDVGGVTTYDTMFFGQPTTLESLFGFQVGGHVPVQYVQTYENIFGRIEMRYCEAHCTECTTEMFCTRCGSPYFLYSRDCVLDCPSQGAYYGYVNGVVRECRACDNLCITCTSGTVCQDCGSNFLLNSICYASCPSEYYDNVAANPNVCSPCENLCTVCQDCGTNFLLNSNCYSTCPSGYYDNTVSNPNECIQCEDPCILCTSDTTCIDCGLSYVLDSSCVDNCPSEGAYFNYDGDPNVCRECSSGCSACNSETNCTDCGNLFLYKGNCYENCSTLGPFFNFIGSTNECRHCEANCTACNSETECTNCGGVLYLYQGSCYADCSTFGSYFNGEFGVCEECSENCVSCSSFYLCLECSTNPDYYLFGLFDGTLFDESVILKKKEGEKTDGVITTKKRKLKKILFYLQVGCQVNCSELGPYFNNESTTPYKCSRCDSGCESCDNEGKCGELILISKPKPDLFLPVFLPLIFSIIFILIIFCLICICVCVYFGQNKRGLLKKISKLKKLDLNLKDKKATKYVTLEGDK